MFRAQGRGDAGVVAHVGEQDRGADPRHLPAQDRARQNRLVRLVAHIDAQHLVEPVAGGAQLDHEGEGRNDHAQDRQRPLRRNPSGERVANEIAFLAPLLNGIGIVR